MLHHGDCLEVLRSMPSDSLDACVTDPPYGLSFMGKGWDYDVPKTEIWREVFRVLKPGAHLLAFAGTRTQHRMAVNIEDAGFEIRDMIAWVYGSGFPKSLDVSKAIDSRKDWGALHKLQAKVKAAREALGISQSEAARRMGLIGPDESLGGGGFMWFETGMRVPSRDEYPRLKAALGLDGECDLAFEEAERQVIGNREMRDTSQVRIAVTASADDYDPGARRVVDITAPAPDAAREWQGWGTALKPALEPITVARKPLSGTVAANVLAHGTGAMNIDGCRVASNGGDDYSHSVCVVKAHNGFDGAAFRHTERTMTPPNTLGRWPANLIHDGSEEVLKGFPETGPSKASNRGLQHSGRHGGLADIGANIKPGTDTVRGHSDAGGSAARFFYCAKASKADRDEGLTNPATPFVQFQTGNGASGKASSLSEGRNTEYRNHHPTVKPTALMRYLCRLVTPPGGTVLDPFMGSGSTGKAAVLEGFAFVGIEREAEYLEIARARIEAAQAKHIEAAQAAPEDQPTLL